MMSGPQIITYQFMHENDYDYSPAFAHIRPHSASRSYSNSDSLFTISLQRHLLRQTHHGRPCIFITLHSPATSFTETIARLRLQITYTVLDFTDIFLSAAVSSDSQ